MTTTTYATQRNLVVRRTLVECASGRMGWDVSVLRRPGQVNPTYQGEVSMFEGAWYFIAATNGAWTGERVGPFASYEAAEKAVVRLRTRVRSWMPWTGPRPARPAPRCACGVCGKPVREDEMCTRRDLHW